MRRQRARRCARRQGLLHVAYNWTNMVVVRNRIASVGAGGPRQFAELRDRFLVSAEPGKQDDASSELDSLGFRFKATENAPILIAEPRDTIEDVLSMFDQQVSDASDAARDIQEQAEEEEGIIESTAAVIRATQGLLEEIRQLSPIRSVSFVNTFADFGPENLRVSPRDMPNVLTTEDRPDTLGTILNDIGIQEAWEVTRGENAAVAIFDTGYAEDLISSSRIAGTFHGDMVDSAFASAEGHGTMCAGAAAANEEEGLPFSGVAPEADVYLIRTTDDEGQIRTDIITEAWDWLIGQAGATPIVTNHSYGTPLCSSLRRPQFCNSPGAEIIRLANSTTDIASCYAAGNEAMYCGHRPSGITNGITGHNSLEDVITVGALLSDAREVQRYSSHGRGDCAPRADPKPNVSMRIPKRTFYGVEDGWAVKDMSTGIFGSSGGTSHASPTIAGAMTLIQSAAPEPLSTEQLKQVIKEHSSPPRATQINQFGIFAGPSGWDARFGFGELDIVSAVQSVSEA